MEEYAREVFPVEEAANGMTWMDEEDDENAEEGESKLSTESAEEARAEAEQNYTPSC